MSTNNCALNITFTNAHAGSLYRFVVNNPFGSSTQTEIHVEVGYNVVTACPSIIRLFYLWIVHKGPYKAMVHKTSGIHSTVLHPHCPYKTMECLVFFIFPMKSLDGITMNYNTLFKHINGKFWKINFKNFLSASFLALLLAMYAFESPKPLL